MHFVDIWQNADAFMERAMMASKEQDLAIVTQVTAEGFVKIVSWFYMICGCNSDYRDGFVKIIVWFY